MLCLLLNSVSKEKRCNVFYKKEASSSENLICATKIRKTNIILCYTQSDLPFIMCSPNGNILDITKCIIVIVKLVSVVTFADLSLSVPLDGLQCVIVVFPDHTHLLFN